MSTKQDVAIKLKECKEIGFNATSPIQKALMGLIYSIAESYINQTDTSLSECTVEEDEFISTKEFASRYNGSVSADYLVIICRTMKEAKEFAELRGKKWYVKEEKMRGYLENQDIFPLVAKRIKECIKNSKNN